MLGLTSCLCSLLGSMLGLVFTFCLTSGSVFTISTSLDLTSGLSFSPSRLIFTLVSILKLGDDISILLLYYYCILYSCLCLVKSDEGTYKIVFGNESGTYKDILSPGNRWLAPDSYLKIFGKRFFKNIGFDVDKPKSGTKSKIPKRKMKQIEMYVDEIDDDTKQFASVLNELPTTSEGNQDDIMLQDIITKNEIATDNSIKLIETSLTEIGAEASTQTGGLTLRELEGLDKELRMISGSLRSAIK